MVRFHNMRTQRDGINIRSVQTVAPSSPRYGSSNPASGLPPWEPQTCCGIREDGTVLYKPF